ncbi:MAG: tRNA (guanosine(37)-N1)-methyltransferase TrmD [Lautropia mirabilis]|nr:tRNA (guanosine(37)-N1)-methyltransferase TrmD [Lautropia mirabilis]
MDFEIITIFPDLVEAAAPYGVVGRARNDAYFLRCWNPRDYTFDNYRRIDDRPYGGGPGMVMLAEPLLRCLTALRETRAAEGRPELPVIYLSPQGQHFAQARAQTMAASDGAIFLCGRYEAIDQRFLDAVVDEEISMGDFVVSGGELPAMLVMDAVVRLLPGVLNHGESAEQDSFAEGAPAQRLLDCPHYTRPEQLPGLPRDVPAGVPPVLLSGNHREIERWRHAAALDATQRKRPELLSAKSVLSSKA